MVYSKKLCLVLILCSYFIGCNSLKLEDIKGYFGDLAVYDVNKNYVNEENWKNGGALLLFNTPLFISVYDNTATSTLMLYFENGKLIWWYYWNMQSISMVLQTQDFTKIYLAATQGSYEIICEKYNGLTETLIQLEVLEDLKNQIIFLEKMMKLFKPTEELDNLQNINNN